MNFEDMGRTTMRVAVGFMSMTLAMGMMGACAMAQTSAQEPEKAKTAPVPRVDTNPDETIYLKNVVAINDANEVVVAARNILDPSFKIYFVPNQNAIVMRGTNEQLALARKIINNLDRPKPTYRLTYTITEIEGGKRVGVQHFAMVVTSGQRTQLKQGSKVPIATGSYSASGSAEAQTQFTYLDVGMNFDSTLESCGNGGRLKAKVEQLGLAEERSGVGPQDPIVRQTVLEGTSFLMPGKPVILGSLDIPGSIRHLDVDVMMEPLTP
jgi:Bacterial type II/III secretion system short domain